MNKEEVKELLKYIKGAYPRFEINEMTLTVWAKAFEKQEKEEVYDKFNKHMVISEFAPAISQIMPKPKGVYDIKETFVEVEKKEPVDPNALRQFG